MIKVDIVIVKEKNTGIIETETYTKEKR